MTDTLRVMLETGTKDKRVVAVAPDWTGLERGATTEEGLSAHRDTCCTTIREFHTQGKLARTI